MVMHQALKGLAAASVESAVASLQELQEAMVAWGVPPPSEGWATWSQNWKDVLRQAQGPPTTEGKLPLQKAFTSRQWLYLIQGSKNIVATSKGNLSGALACSKA